MNKRLSARSAVACGAVALAVVPLTTAARGRIRQIDVSHARGSQWEVAVTADPRNPRRLLAGSNQDFRSGIPIRYYTSANGGVSWTSADGPPLPVGLQGDCTADPAPAIGPDGRQYLAYLTLDCSGVGYQSLFVSTRPNATAPWSRPTAPIVPAQVGFYDDKDAIAVDAYSKRFRGRVYLVWSRGAEAPNQESFGPSTILLSHSDDGGSSWSAPVSVGSTSRPGTVVTFAGVAVARNGDVYVSWDRAGTRTLWIARSTDGGASFSRRVRAAYAAHPSPKCFASGTSIPAQPVRCVGASPALAVDRSRRRSTGRVYLAYMTLSARNRSEDVVVRSFSPALRALRRPARIGGAERGAPDQFQPVIAVDSKDGALWACFYQAVGPRARFSCALSHFGGRAWTRTVAAASVPSNETQPGALPSAYGEYQGLSVAGGTAHPLWTDSRRLPSLREEIYGTVLRERSMH